MRQVIAMCRYARAGLAIGWYGVPATADWATFAGSASCGSEIAPPSGQERRELPQRLRGEAGGVAIDESHNEHAPEQQPDRLGVVPHLLAAVDDGMVQRRRQRIDGFAIPGECTEASGPVTASSCWTTLSGAS
jgi:hypothetical protein